MPAVHQTMIDATPELDIRWPIGLLFAAIGALLVVYGALHPDGARSLGLNLNLVWGAVMFLFGAGLTWGAWRAGKKPS
jgi:protein-S-isoprenylcysteine O-methyltransferase Ste14